MYFGSKLFGGFPDIFPLLISSLSLLWSENILCIIGIILNIEICLMAQNINYLGVSCAHEKKNSLLNRVLYKCQLDQVGWQCSKFLYIYCFLSACSVDSWKMGIEISSSNCGFVYFFPCSSIFFFHFMFFEALLHVFRISMSSWWIGTFIVSLQSDPSLAMVIFFALKSTLSDINIDSYCSFVLASVSMIQPFTFNLLGLFIWDKFLVARV